MVTATATPAEIQNEHTLRFKAAVMELLDLPVTPLTRQDLKDIEKAELRIRKQTLPQRIAAIADCYGRSPVTIRRWHDLGLNLWDAVAVHDWARWKESRNKKRANPDCRVRRIRGPLD